MQLTATSPIAAILCLAILWLGPARGLILTFAALPFGSAAAVNLSGLGSIFIAEIAMLTLGLSLVLKGVGGRDVLVALHPRYAGFPLLLLMLTTGIGAIFLPRVNAGITEVYTLVRQADGATLALRALQPSGSNIGQFFRFLLAGCACAVVILTAMRFATAARIKQAVLTATLVHIGLSVVDLIGPLFGMNLLAPFRNAYVAILDDQLLLGVRRLIAGFPEPSAFGIYTIGLFGFWLRLWFGAPRSVLASALVILLAALLVRSTSTAAYFGLLFYTVLFFLWQARAVAKDSNAVIVYAVLTFLMPLMIGAVVVVYQLVPVLSDFANTVVFEKLNSTSGSERMSWNRQALENFLETYGTGAGIGSLRASGWAFAVLGSIGVLGAVFYVWFLATTLRVRFIASRESTCTGEVAAALQAGCFAILLLSLSILPQPNLGLAFFLMAGAVTGLKLRQRQETRRLRPLWGPAKAVIFGTVRG